MYSFIKPEPRPLFSIFSKLWISFIAIVFALFLVANAFISFKNYSLKSRTTEFMQNQKKMNDEIVKIDEITEILSTQVEIANNVTTSNLLLKQSLHNLFDLVPDSITLEEVHMDKNLLIIRGITPSKDVFNQLLASPLKSIFSTSNTSFYQIKNGWYGFVSTNKMDTHEGYNE
ncbi:hypothetical protein LMG7974_00345 [Campylobacter majalis]|uniref:Uncharacterized protein n=2 Tax=Campylobacter majalis TaxID=2790656 RepID=A0ABM8Q3K4_9BACT|nr:hypothetical protein [Campylobacter majalis]CAD7287466.1 hypothetical protein LMG7974_00345 [Campylobacter majalis]